MSEDINVNQMSEAINNKMDRDWNNMVLPGDIKDKLIQAGIILLTTSYIDPDDPSKGYNIWSNGYCEQWGKWLNTSTATTATINLKKNYKNTDYNIQAYVIFAANGNSYNPVTLYDNPTVDSFTVYNASMNAVNRGFYWKTCGFLAEGQY